MKRIGAWILTVCLVLGLAAAPASAADSATIQATVQALGIMVGDENGSMNLSANVTRAQFCKMMVAASVYKDTVDEEGGMSLFSDVRASHWAAEYIRVAVEQGWFQGYSDGTFRPEKTITTEEAAAALLRLLGYEDSDLAGTYPNAQLSKFRALGLGDGISVSRGQTVSRSDAMYMFYNLMTAQTKSGSVYATTLGYTLTAGGELNYAGIVENDLSGPYTRNPGEALQLPFSGGNITVYLNGTAASLSDVDTYDIYYYNENLRTVYAYSNRVTGTYTAASPSTMSPSLVTVAGVSYEVSTASAAYKLSAMGGFSLGDQVTLLLGMDGTVADVIAAAENDEITYGVVVGSTQKSYTDESGAVQTSSVVRVACTDGVVREYETAGTYRNGAMVSISYAGSQSGVRSLSSRSLSGKVSTDGTKIGDYTFAENVQILDTDEYGGYRRIYPSRLAGCTLKSSDVRWYTTDSGGNITHMILDDATGDVQTYGVLTRVEELVSGMTVSGQYGYIQNGQSGTIMGSTVYNVTTGGARFLYDDEGQLQGIRNLERMTVTRLTSSTAQSSSGTWKVAEDVQVYLRNGSTYSLVNIASISDLEQYSVTAYYDDLGYSAGGLVRVIVATAR